MERIWILANELLEQQKQVSRKPKAFCEQILTAASLLFPTKLAKEIHLSGRMLYLLFIL